MRQATVITAILVLLTPFSANGGELALGGATFKGTTVNIPVVLKGDVGTGVASMNFTVTYDPAVFEPLGVMAGEAASAADKGVHYNLLEPGRCTVVMMGMNQTVVPSGEVAMLRLRRLTTGNSSTELGIDDPTFAALNASSIPSKGTTETIDLAAGETATPAETETDTGDGTTPETAETPDSTAAPGSTDVTSPGVPAPSTAGDGTTPQTAAGQSGLPGAAPVGTKPALAGNPKDPALANRLKQMARMGDASQLPRGIQAGAPGTPAGAAPVSAGTVGAPPGAQSETPGTLDETSGVVAKQAPSAVGDLAMNPAGAPGQAAATVATVSKAAASTAVPSKSGAGVSLKWVGVGAIVLAMGVLFLLRRRMFS